MKEFTLKKDAILLVQGVPGSDITLDTLTKFHENIKQVLKEKENVRLITLPDFLEVNVLNIEK